MPDSPSVLAAGALVWRDAPDGPHVLVVHRPRYEDWSIPKGKLDPAEHALAAAVREVEEETGVRVRLGPSLPSRRYHLADGALKEVHYWLARPLGDARIPAYEPNAEVDEVAWLGVDDAARRLTSVADVALLESLDSPARASNPLVILRHAKALPRKEWSGEDSARPLAEGGQEQAHRIPALLNAYGIDVAISSDATRCLETVRPFLDTGPVLLVDEHNLSEQAEQPAAVRDLMAALLHDSRPTVVCTHRPVLPLVFAAVGMPVSKLAPGEMVVLHRRAGAVISTERHTA